MHTCDNCMTGRCPLCGGNAHRTTKIAAGWQMDCQECGASREYTRGAWCWFAPEHYPARYVLDPDQSG